MGTHPALKAALAFISRSGLGRALALAGVIALAALSFACSDSDPEPTASAATPAPEPTAAPTPKPAPTPTPAPPSVISHSAAASADIPLVAFAAVKLSAPGRVAVEYENEFAGKFRTALSERAAEHAIPMARLRADTVYQYAVALETADGALEYAARGEFRSAPLPDNDFAALVKTASGESSQPLILGDIHVRSQSLRYLIMWDALGEAVWLYPDSEPSPRMIPFARVQPNGDLLYIKRGDGDSRLRRITPLGEVADETDIAGDTPHHDFLQLDGGRILYLGLTCVDPDAPEGCENEEENPRLDTVNIFSPLSGDAPRVERVWNPLDIWDEPDEWRLNFVSAPPDGGWLLSKRRNNEITRVSDDFQTVLWQLGGPESDFAFPDPADMFGRQHTPEILPNGNVLLFDNDAKLLEGDAAYSRAIELRLDFDAMTAVKVWEHVPEPRIYSPTRGSAYRLDNGNTLINYGTSDDPAIPAAIIETDAQGREIFKLETATPPDRIIDFSMYRANPGPESVIGETTLRPPKRR